MMVQLEKKITIPYEVVLYYSNDYELNSFKKTCAEIYSITVLGKNLNEFSYGFYC